MITSEEQIERSLPREFRLLSPVRHTQDSSPKSSSRLRIKCLSPTPLLAAILDFLRVERSRPSLTPHHVSHKRQALVSPPILFSALDYPEKIAACTENHGNTVPAEHWNTPEQFRNTGRTKHWNTENHSVPEHSVFCFSVFQCSVLLVFWRGVRVFLAKVWSCLWWQVQNQQQTQPI